MATSHRARVPRRRPPGQWAARANRPADAVQGFGLVALGVLAAGAGAGVLLDAGIQAVGRWRQAPPGARAPAQLLAGLSAGAAALLLAWLALAAMLAMLALAGGELGRRVTPIAGRLAPTALRAAVVAVVGGSLAVSAGVATGAPRPAGSAGTALSADGPPIVRAPASPGSARPVSALAAPSSAPPPGPAPVTGRADAGLVTTRPAPGRHPDPEVVVRPGDTLWSITARQLGPEATAVQVAREWPRWFAANRATIGPDPDQLRPGQRLVPPQ